MIRLYGRCEANRRLVDTAPHGRWSTTTFIADLRHDRLTAPCVFNGADNGEMFLACIEQVLIPSMEMGDVVVMNSLSAHKVPASGGH